MRRNRICLMTSKIKGTPMENGISFENIYFMNNYVKNDMKRLSEWCWDDDEDKGVQIAEMILKKSTIRFNHPGVNLKDIQFFLAPELLRYCRAENSKEDIFPQLEGSTSRKVLRVFIPHGAMSNFKSFFLPIEVVENNKDKFILAGYSEEEYSAILLSLEMVDGDDWIDLEEILNSKS